jgi:hypothetical protein
MRKKTKTKKTHIWRNDETEATGVILVAKIAGVAGVSNMEATDSQNGERRCIHPPRMCLSIRLCMHPCTMYLFSYLPVPYQQTCRQTWLQNSSGGKPCPAASSWVSSESLILFRNLLQPSGPYPNT